jgi:DMSO/TMAO reductase YedYZ molybdopterin-dependent catalytic subunit
MRARSAVGVADRRDVRWSQALGAGALAGAVAALAMTLVMVILRYALGVATPAELFGDRLAPTLTIAQFFALLDRFGGYNELKQAGVTRVLGGQLAVGLLGGVAYALVVERQRARPPGQALNFGAIRSGRLFMALFVGSLWLITLLFLWPVLGTHYGGLPPGQATWVTAVGLLVSYGVYGLVLMRSYRTFRGSATSRTLGPFDPASNRRAVLVGGLGVLAAIGTGALLRRLYSLATFSYDGRRYGGPDIQPIVPNDRFYVVSKNVIDPSITPSVWRLEITGQVEQPWTYRLEDLLSMPAVTQETTLECISNGVGDGLMSNAVWKGVPLRRVLEAARPRSGAVAVLLHAVDGYTDSFDFDKAMDATTLVVYEMNGAPLPVRHGYPARIIVPGLFGEKNVKWVTRVELVDRQVKGFYARQGWGPNFVIPTESRFDQPSDGQTIHSSMGSAVPLKGIAFAGARGVSGVEVSLDGAVTWHQTRIDYRGAPMAWVLWSFDWHPMQPGRYTLVVRATDGTGTLQTPEERSFAPEGATGYHRISVHVDV